MDLKQIEKLMAAMEESRIKRIVLKREDFEIEIERECAGTVVTSLAAPTTFAPTPIAHMEMKPLSPSATSPANESSEKSNAHFVTSPMVGTFYAAPSPEDPPFVKAGDQVNEESVVCIIEAMKVMNEVKAGVKGTVVDVLVKSGEPVEFGTHIIRVNPA